MYNENVCINPAVATNAGQAVELETLVALTLDELNLVGGGEALVITE